MNVFTVSFTLLVGSLALGTPAQGQTEESGAVTELERAIRAYSAGQCDEATPLLESVLRSQTGSREVYLMLASCYLDSERSVEAYQLAQRALFAFPQDLIFRVLMADAMLQRGQAEEALAVYREVEPYAGTIALQEVDTGTLQVRLGGAYTSMGNRALAAGQHAEAKGFFWKALEHSPPSDAYNNLAYILIEEKLSDQAEPVVDAGLARFPRATGLLRLKALILQERHEGGELREVLRRLHEIEPEDIDIALAYGEILVSTNYPTEATAHFETLIDRFPDDKRVYDGIARIQLDRHDFQGRMDILRRQRARFPQDNEVLWAIGQTHERLEDWDSARTAYDSLAWDPDQAHRARMAIAGTHLAQDDDNAAITAYAAMAETWPGDLSVLARWGRLLEKQDRWLEADDVYARLDKAGSGHYAQVRRGWVNEQLGRKIMAESLYGSALEAEVEDPLPAYRLSRFALDGRESEEAFRLAELALRKSLLGVKSQQSAALGTLSADPENAPGDSPPPEPLDNGMSLRERGDAASRFAREVYDYFTASFPRRRVESKLSELVERYQGSTVLYTMVAEFKLKGGDAIEAQRLLEEAVYYAPRYLPAQSALADLYEANGDTRQAMLAYERVLGLDDRDRAIYSKLIKLSRDTGELNALCDRWLAHYRTADENPVLRDALIEALHRAQRIQEADRLHAEARAEKEQKEETP